MKTSHRSFAKLLRLTLCAVIFWGAAACSPQKIDNDPVSVVTKNLEAQAGGYFNAWVSTLVKEKQAAYTKEANGEFGVIRMKVDAVEVSEEETQRMKERYTGSVLAMSRGWSDEYIAENMIVVVAQYTVAFDHTKVPYNDGTIKQDFILIRDDKDSPWLIWETGSPDE